MVNPLTRICHLNKANYYKLLRNSNGHFHTKILNIESSIFCKVLKLLWAWRWPHTVQDQQCWQKCRSPPQTVTAPRLVCKHGSRKRSLSRSEPRRVWWHQSTQGCRWGRRLHSLHCSAFNSSMSAGVWLVSFFRSPQHTGINVSEVCCRWNHNVLPCSTLKGFCCHHTIHSHYSFSRTLFNISLIVFNHGSKKEKYLHLLTSKLIIFFF